ncbi:MAG: septal ring lytic transglycosylase RlpA family protein [Candidatus Schekmanbacteria bacterium]|nr:septal ring lytic transglycosylase RlpA family protein [Candidatus Schekmanbacteria bacterium]
MPGSFWRFILTSLILKACAFSGNTSIPLAGYSNDQGKSFATFQPYTAGGETYYPAYSNRDFVEEGIASWYGVEFHGRSTASGEVYDMYERTAAHRTLPMDTYARVTNLLNGQRVIVRINDRGPFSKKRVMDMSYSAAKALGMLENGTAPVRIEALGHKVIGEGRMVRYEPKDFYFGNFTVQVGAFQEKTNAERLINQLSKGYGNAHYVVYDSPQGRFYRVRVGKYDNLEKAESARRSLEKTDFGESFIVAE